MGGTKESKIPLVLVVEDMPSIRYLLEVALTQEGMRVVTAATAAEALQVAQDAPPDLVLLDLLLPDARGDAVVTAMRELPTLSQIPVIVVSGVGEAGRVSRQFGAQDCLMKPFDLSELLARIRHHLTSRRAPMAP